MSMPTINIPEIAFQHLSKAVREVQMICKPPRFTEGELTESECGTYAYLLTEKFYLVILRATKDYPAIGDYGFYGGDMSNFSGIDAVGVYCEDKIRRMLLNIRFDCGEQYFKLMCALLHVDETGKNLEVVDAVLNAVEPKKAKFATFKVKDFDTKKWDEASPEVMYKAQLHKLRCPTMRDHLLWVAGVAQKYGVLPENLHFTENTADIPGVEAVPATETTPAVEAKKGEKADKIWGTGVGVKPLFDAIVAEGNTARLHQSFANPGYGSNGSDALFDGKNRLGSAIDKAFLKLTGANYEYVGETMADFVRRVMAEKGFDYLVYTPAPTPAPTPTPAAMVLEERPVTPITFTENAEFVTPADKIITTLEEPPAKRSRSDRISDDEEAGEEAPLSRSMSCVRTLSDQY